MWAKMVLYNGLINKFLIAEQCMQNYIKQKLSKIAGVFDCVYLPNNKIKNLSVKEHMVWLLVTDGLIIWGHFLLG